MTKEASSKFEKLIATLQQQLELTSTEIADILWLAQQNQTTVDETSNLNKKPAKTPEPVADNQTQPPINNPPDTQNTTAPPARQPAELKAEVYAKSSRTSSGDTRDIPLPDALGLPEPLKLTRALRPLMQKIDSGTEVILDEEATADRIAKEGIRIPVFQPAQEPAFDLMLVVDESNTMILWRKTIQELQKLFEVQGAFRDVQVWGLLTNPKGDIYLRRGMGKTGRKHRHCQPRSLVDPSSKRLFLIASDCVANIWHNGKAFEILKIWAKKHPVAIIQMFPQWMWQRTGLSLGAKVQFSSLIPRIANQDLLIKKILLWDDIDFITGIKIPIFTLEEQSARTWSKMIGGRSDAHVTGFVLPSNSTLFTIPEADSQTQEIEEETTEEITSNFRRTASPIARKLASLLSAAPVINLPIVRIIQAQILKERQQVHVAEVLLGGIIKRKYPIEITSETNPDEIEFEFINEEVQNNFLKAAPISDSLEIFSKISTHFAKKLNKTFSNFNASLRKPQHENDEIKPFAFLDAKSLRRLGEEYVQFAIIATIGVSLEPFEFDVAVITPDINPEKEPGEKLQSFEFETVTINTRGQIINREQNRASYFIELLGKAEKTTVALKIEMVAIPGGSFEMGSLKNEREHRGSESPQHTVTVQPFFIGKYPITQAQWRFVAHLPQVNRELKPDPSRFKGMELPVERVSWYDAVEFCDRLSNYTGRTYTLPSEAEWEYACRAGTTTPFHFGETITSELANYNATKTYDNGAKGEYREKTTPVGSFGVANAFGLYDMHGNVFEWCLDDWHDNYEGAPIDGSPWLKDNNNISQNKGTSVLRGGSWFDGPGYCRSASRNFFFRADRDDIDDFFGFRIACGVGRTFQ